MARLPITPYVPLGAYPTLPLVAASATLTEAAPGVAADGISFPLTGQATLLIVHSLDAGAQTVTISSVPDDQNRTGDIAAYSIPAAGIAVFGPFRGEKGWRQADGMLYAVAATTTLKFTAVRIP